ncbi:MAG: hypothetical protein M3321_01550 [Actinomycetota bacterium]|nr:hypothetical protein [Actinomycetota bacterium]
MSRWSGGTAVALVALATAGSAFGSSSTALVVRPGVSIGKVRLGMTLPEVRRILGRPEAVSRRETRGFGVRYVEYQWRYATWRVGFRGRGEHLRAVRIGTTLSTQRTPAGIGPGSNTGHVARRYGSRISCVSRTFGRPDSGTWLVLRGPGTRMTAFALIKAGGGGYAPRARPVVAETLVQYSWATGGTQPCYGDWRAFRW